MIEPIRNQRSDMEITDASINTESVDKIDMRVSVIPDKCVTKEKYVNTQPKNVSSTSTSTMPIKVKSKGNQSVLLNDSRSLTTQTVSSENIVSSERFQICGRLFSSKTHNLFESRISLNSSIRIPWKPLSPSMLSISPDEEERMDKMSASDLHYLFQDKWKELHRYNDELSKYDFDTAMKHTTLLRRCLLTAASIAFISNKIQKCGCT